jgi:F0F1-type ATP synthase membrane subunit b/b'
VDRLREESIMIIDAIIFGVILAVVIYFGLRTILTILGIREGK